MVNLQRSFIVLSFLLFSFGSVIAQNLFYLDYDIWIYQDESLSAKGIEWIQNKSSLERGIHIFTESKSGELLIDGEWLDASRISEYLLGHFPMHKALPIFIYDDKFGYSHLNQETVTELKQLLEVEVYSHVDLASEILDSNAPFELLIKQKQKVVLAKED